MGLSTSDLIITILVELFMTHDVFACLTAAVKNNFFSLRCYNNAYWPQIAETQSTG